MKIPIAAESEMAYNSHMYTSKWILVWGCVALLLPIGVLAATLTDSTVVTGDASVLGALSKGSGTFMIDHPLDPKNKLLYHSFVESPDVKNVYDGVVQMDARGEATVVLPHYFVALNKDFRYLATSIGEPMPNLHLAYDIERSFLTGKIHFGLAGGVPNGKVSWQVTGIRRDQFILANPIIPEVDKGEGQPVLPGECIFEPLCN